MSKPSEEKWVREARSGNKAAFGNLVNKYYEMIYAVTFGVLKNREAAKDVTQEVFMKAYRDLHKFDGRSKFKTWIYRVAFNAAVDQYRKKKPAQSIDATDATSEDQAPVIIEEHRLGPRDLAAQSELKERMERALEKLSPEHRAVLVFREWEGLSYEEIAEAMGIEIGTVMSRLHYARKKLQEALKVIWIEETR